MNPRRLILILALLLPVLSWGQSVFVKEKIALAEEIRTSKGICVEFVDALYDAYQLAMNEEDWLTAARTLEDFLSGASKVYPEDKELISDTKNMIALLYFEAGEHEKAIPLLKEFYKTSRGQDFDMDSGLLESIISSYIALNNWKEAISYRRQKNELVLKNLGRGIQYAEGLYMLSTLYIEVADESNAIRALKEALQVLEQTDEKHEGLYNEVKYRYEILTTGISSVPSGSEVRRHAIELVQRGEKDNDIMPMCEAMDYLEDKTFLPDIDTLRYHILTSIGHVLYDKGDFNNVLDVTLKKAYWTSDDWWLIGNCHESLGMFADAREDYKLAFANAFQEKNDVSEEYFYYFDCYARNCIQTGQYEEVFNLLEQFYAADVEIPDYQLRAALYMSSLAELKYSISDYKGAVECIEKCAPLLLKVGAIEDYTMRLSQAAACYEQLGDYAACARVMESLLEVYKSDPQYIDYVPGIEVTAALYYAQAGMNESAKESVKQTIQRFSEHKFSDFWMESVFHNSLGHYYQFYSDNVNAEKEYIAGARILKANAIESDGNYPNHLATLGLLYLQWPQNEHKALPVFEEAFNLIKKYHDPSYALYFGFYEGLLAAKYASGSPTPLAEISGFVDVEKLQAQTLLFQMSETEREAFWKSHSDVKNLVFSFEESQSNPSFLYDYALLYKGLLLSSSMQIGNIVMQASDDELSALYGRYLILSMAKETDDRSRETLDALEHQILSRCRTLGYTLNESYSASDVSAALGDKSVAIEFVDYEQLEAAADKDGVIRYVALVQKKGWREPRLIPLCTAEELKTALDEKHKAYEDNSLYNLIWKPLESQLGDATTVYYSPSGLIHQIALEAIPYSKGKILSERYSLVRLSSTRELCNKSNTISPYATSVVYGGLQYSLSDEDMVSNSQLYSYRSTPVSDDYLNRGGDTASPWRFLPGTRAEAEAVSALLSSGNISSTLFTGAAGNEESFKSLSGQGPSILHIATHGFYLQNKDFGPSATGGSDVRGQLQIQKSALKRSGLIMSGANPAWTEGRLLPNVEDGILTAEEISRLDLRNTSLAIISACDSGLGEINNDGVEGLQRAFKAAGVNTLVVTLWQVDDTATELMMTEFYKNLIGGHPLREAFDLARTVVKVKFPEPYYWAPFVMID